ncbi:MAG: IclR family transcriptional regulator [Enterococcus aquimarinus]|uniref:IclR family transcriptional regulator n=1 Tax=Enterococcus aquimarinus TaxID=328396 RepID=A0A9E3ZSC1_9ENTE|nr:IclR family transcriptional regulator [Enterococcus aquimarinus]
MISEEINKSVLNATRIIDLISQREGLGISDIAKELQLPKTSTFRLLKTLEVAGLLIQTNEETYYLSYKFLTYQVGVNEDQNLIHKCLPTIQKISEQTGETVNLTVNRLGKMYNIHSEVGEYYALQSNLAPESELYCSSSGKIFLSYMNDEQLKNYFNHPLLARTIHTITEYEAFIPEKETILSKGIAYDREEYEYGLTCLSVAVLQQGQPIATIGISGPTTRLQYKNFAEIEQLLITEVAQINS